MVKRKQITIIYSYDELWIGGAYYILNIIKALNYLGDSLKPELTVVHHPKISTDPIKATEYPYLVLVAKDVDSFSFLKKVINKIFFLTMGNNLFKTVLPGKNIYPADFKTYTKNISNYYFWVPDLQDCHLPHFFTSKELKTRKRHRESLVKYKRSIVFSSENAKNDFDVFYPRNLCLKKVLPFVSILNDDFKKLEIESLKKKFQIDQPYFIVSNQFWKHKNHEVVLKAVKILFEKGIKFQLVFTGKEYDHGGNSSTYIKDLKKYVKENKLDDCVLFLGFIERNEQLQLANNSISIIQPSLFEGWSTIVEDAKALDHFILVSDIPIHREQIDKHCNFFEPNDSEYLASLMEHCLQVPPSSFNWEYEKNIKQFSENFIGLFY